MNNRDTFFHSGGRLARAVAGFLILLALAFLQGCGKGPSFLPHAGPSSVEIQSSAALQSSIAIVDINAAVVQRLAETQKKTLFSEVFGDNAAADYVVGAGDLLEIVIWEAQPSALFTLPVSTLPPQMVAGDGTINVPFAGMIKAAGKAPHDIETQIVERLADKAHEPQVLVRVAHNFSSNVTVVGEVGQNVRMPLTAKGERLLDALAVAGGVRYPVEKVTIQITRNGEVQSMPLDAVTRDPRQNIALNAGDVVTALFQPLSFTAMGAIGQNAEIPFEAKGITLSQALGRIGGLADHRSDPQGIFVFRFEDQAAVNHSKKKPALTPDGRVPVVYRLNLQNPAAFLVAQGFPVRDKDIIYVANAPAVEFQKFMNIIFTSVFSVHRLLNL